MIKGRTSQNLYSITSTLISISSQVEKDSDLSKPFVRVRKPSQKNLFLTRRKSEGRDKTPWDIASIVRLYFRKYRIFPQGEHVRKGQEEPETKPPDDQTTTRPSINSDGKSRAAHSDKLIDRTSRSHPSRLSTLDHS